MKRKKKISKILKYLELLIFFVGIGYILSNFYCAIFSIDNSEAHFYFTLIAGIISFIVIMVDIRGDRR